MKTYIVKDKETGLYRSKQYYRPDRWTADINRARTYPRTCDVKNSIQSKDFDSRYQIIPCEIVPQLPKEYYRVEPTIPDKIIIKVDGSHWKKMVFESKQAADAYVQQSSQLCNLYPTYFKVVPIAKEVFDKEKPQVQRPPNWRDYFLGLALVVSKKSHDIHTQHGCVIVDSQTNHILATGYNGFPRGMRDDSLPTNRIDPKNPDAPNKYDWMIHSEANACNNMLLPANEYSIAYVTGEPCTPCLMTLWQKGVTQVIHRKAYGGLQVTDRSRKNREILLAQTGMRVYAVEPDLSWLLAAVSPN